MRMIDANTVVTIQVFDEMYNANDFCSHGERQRNYFGERREP